MILAGFMPEIFNVENEFYYSFAFLWFLEDCLNSSFGCLPR